MKRGKYQSRQSYPETEQGELRVCGWLVCVLALAFLLIGIVEYPGKTPVSSELETVTGVYQNFWSVGRGRSEDWRLQLEDGKIYRISETIDFSRNDFKARAKRGDRLTLYLSEECVVGIYDEEGRAIHSVEQSWIGKQVNNYIYFLIAIGLGLAGGGMLSQGYLRRRVKPR